jgi:hypothetical protein
LIAILIPVLIAVEIGVLLVALPATAAAAWAIAVISVWLKHH